MTEYIILRKHPDNPDQWHEIPGRRFNASSSRRALSSLDPLPDGEYVAVPARSWKPLTVKVEQTTKVTIG